MTRVFVAIVLAFLSSVAPRAARDAAESDTDTFVFLKPTIHITDEDRRRLDERDVVLRILPASGHELAVLAAGSLDAGPDALVASVRDMPGLKRGPYVPQIGRFSSPPRLEDLRELTLEEADLDEIRRCRPERCSLKLAPDEVRRLQSTISTHGRNARGPLEDEFRRIVLERANQYLLRGDDESQAQFATLLQHSPYVQSQMPQLVSYLEQYPATRLSECESFLYWSKETYAWKPMITVTHVTILRGDGGRGAPEVVVTSRDVFATRYTSGSFILTLLLRAPDSPSKRYLVYINRTWVDAIRSLWRPFVEYRVKNQAKKIFAGARERIERNGLARTSQK